jgi:hypothetical protein
MPVLSANRSSDVCSRPNGIVTSSIEIEDVSVANGAAHSPNELKIGEERSADTGAAKEAEPATSDVQKQSTTVRKRGLFSCCMAPATDREEAAESHRGLPGNKSEHWKADDSVHGSCRSTHVVRSRTCLRYPLSFAPASFVCSCKFVLCEFICLKLSDLIYSLGLWHCHPTTINLCVLYLEELNTH